MSLGLQLTSTCNKEKFSKQDFVFYLETCLGDYNSDTNALSQNPNLNSNSFLSQKNTQQKLFLSCGLEPVW